MNTVTTQQLTDLIERLREEAKEVTPEMAVAVNYCISQIKELIEDERV